MVRTPSRAVMLAAACVSATAASITPLTSWSLTTSANVSDSGAAISSSTYVPNGWLSATVPCTVLACLVQNDWYNDLFYSQNVNNVPTAQFNVSWWYRTSFDLPPLPAPPAGGERQAKAEASAVAAAAAAATATLRFLGVNYRANVWLNGQLVASNSTVVGTFRYLELDITGGAVWGGTGGRSNGLAIEVFRPYDRSLPATNKDTDLALTFVDWAPTPPDNNMGLWRGVELRVQGGVGLRDAGVFTALPPASGAEALSPSTASSSPAPPVSFPYADLTVVVQAVNWDTAAPATGTLSGTITTADGRVILSSFAQTVTLAPGADEAVYFTAGEFPQLRIMQPDLWWPWQMMEGGQTFHVLDLQWIPLVQEAGEGEGEGQATATAAAAPGPSDVLSTRFGIRTATSELDGNGNRLFRVNGQRVLVRAGGWSPDLLLRPNQTLTATHMAYTRAMGLNAIRLEGKLEPDELFSMTDELGLLMLPGWCCCDAWQHWSLWGPEQWAVAEASMRSQARRLRSHPSVLGYLLSSDELPPAAVEGLYLNVTAAEGWPSFAASVSAASVANSTLTGPTGVKMSGPYSWVPPNYWQEDNGTHQLGGAWGFLTEGGPGEAPLTPESLAAVVPSADLWPPAPDDCWGHCGSPLGNFWMLARFNGPLAARYGNATGLEDYLAKASLQTYEGHRAMWEGYSRNKYAPATGVVQWMLQNAAPSNIWHLFQWDLTPGPSYFATAGPLRPLHALYSYDGRGVWLVNSAYQPTPGPEAGNVTVTAEVFGPRDEPWWNASVAVPSASIPGDASVPVPALVLPSQAQIQAWAAAGGYGAYMLRLTDVMDWGASTWWDTPVTTYANLTALASIPPVDGLSFSGQADTVTLLPGQEPPAGIPAAVAWMAQPQAGNITAWTRVNVTLSNAGPGMALHTRLRLLPPGADPSAAAADPAPVFWSDNYLTVRAGEAVTVQALLPASVLPASPMPAVVALPFNNRQR